MTKRWASGLVGCAVLLAGVACASEADDDLGALLRQRIDEQHLGVGVVVGILQDGQLRFESRGASGNPLRPSVDPDTLFEIGSLTKLFTATLLAGQVVRGDVKLGTTLGELWPGVAFASETVRGLTLRELVTHSAGLPRIPLAASTLADALLCLRDPHRDTQPGDLLRYIAGITEGGLESVREHRGRFDYSNLGVAVLGHSLAARAKVPYEELVRREVLTPLALGHTTFDVPAADAANKAHGHRENGVPTANWHAGAYAPAGGLWSSARDLLKFADAHLRGALPGMESMRAEQLPRDGPGKAVGLGWMIRREHGDEILWHSGGTGGYRTFLGIAVAKRRAVVVLSNSASPVDDLGFHLMNPAFTLDAPRPSWLLVLSTALVLALPPLRLLSYRLALTRAPGPQPGRLRRPPRDRLDVVMSALASIGLAVVFYRIGPWNTLPLPLFWVAQALGAAALAWLVPALRDVPWVAPEGRWAAARTALNTAFVLALLAFGLFSL